MGKNFRPGSMGADEQKSTRIFCIVASIVIVFVSLLFYANLFDTYFGAYFKRADLIWKILSVPCFIGSVFSLWKLSGYTWGERGAWLHGFIVLLLLGLGFACASGWDWNLRGIE